MSYKTCKSIKYKIRYLILSIALLFIVGGLVFRVVSLHIFEQDFLRNQGDARTIRVSSIPAYRGMITDRNGEPLAISTPVASVWVNPKEFDKNHPQLLALANALDISLEELFEKIARNSEREFVYLKRHITPHASSEITSLAVSGVHLNPEFRRYYPAGEVAAHVLGFTDVDDRGQEGLEKAFDESLRGIPGAKRVIRDRQGCEVQTLEGLRETRAGQDVVLSIDQRLQYLAYRELKTAVTKYRAIAGTAIVLDVRTGEVLAMVNQPSFNSNLRVKLYNDGRYRNRAVTDAFEAGSVLKTFSIANALQNGVVTPTTLVDTSPGWMTVGGHVVRDDNKNFGVIDVSTILQKSSNVGITKLTLSLPPDRLHQFYSRLGFGSTTGSGFPGESTGVLHPAPKQSSFVLATLAFGYGLTVTPLQLAQSYAILGAGGIKRPVTFLKQSEIPAGEQVIDSVVARQMVDMLEGVVKQGGGTAAKVVGYHTAGKTGTARKVGQGGYQKNNHMAFFAGLAPASNPQFAIVVMIDDPQGALYYGSQIAAPVFSKIASGALRLFNVPPDIMDSQGLRVAQFGQTPCHD